MRYGLLILLSVIALFTKTARADCGARSSCVCSGDARAVADGVVVSVTDTESQFRIDAIEGDAVDAAAGSTLTFERMGVSVGERRLAAQFTSDNSWRLLSRVNESDQYTCDQERALRLSVDEAVNLVLAGNCDALFEAKAKEQGIEQQECNDVLFGCRTAAGALTALALIPLLLRRRKAATLG